MRDGKAVLLWRLTPFNPPRALSGEAAPLTALHGATGFPIVRHFKCLGSQLSYHNHADLTLAFRQQQAKKPKYANLLTVAEVLPPPAGFLYGDPLSGPVPPLALRLQDSLFREPGSYRPGLVDNSGRLSSSNHGTSLNISRRPSYSAVGGSSRDSPN